MKCLMDDSRKLWTERSLENGRDIRRRGTTTRKDSKDTGRMQQGRRTTKVTRVTCQLSAITVPCNYPAKLGTFSKPCTILLCYGEHVTFNYDSRDVTGRVTKNMTNSSWLDRWYSWRVQRKIYQDERGVEQVETSKGCSFLTKISLLLPRKNFWSYQLQKRFWLHSDFKSVRERLSSAMNQQSLSLVRVGFLDP